MALSKDIREKVVKAIKGGMSRRQAAARFDVGPATAVRWAKRVETTGDVRADAHMNDRADAALERAPHAALLSSSNRFSQTVGSANICRGLGALS